MPRLSYGGLTLPFEDTQAFRQVPVEESNQYLHTATEVAVSSVLTPTVICLPGESFRGALQRVRHLLEKPRQAFYLYLDDGTPYLSVPAGADVAGGPHTRVIDLHTFAGTDSAHLTWAVTVATRDCPNAGMRGPDWTHFSWRESLDLDDEHVATRTRTGVLRLRGDRLNFNVLDDRGNLVNATADGFRGLVNPSIPNWFVRTSARYEVQEDGLALRFTYVDRERYAMPPKPAVKATGRYTLNTGNGAKMVALVQFAMSGRMDAGDHRDPNRPDGVAPSTGKQKLLETCIAVAMNRLKRGLGQNSSTRRWHIIGEVWSDEYAPSVSVSLRTMAAVPVRATEMTGGVFGGLFGGSGAGQAVGTRTLTADEQKRRAAGLGAGVARAAGVGDEIPRGLARFGWDEPPLYYDDLPTKIGRGSAPLLRLLAKALNDPCLDAAAGAGGVLVPPFRMGQAAGGVAAEGGGRAATEPEGDGLATTAAAEIPPATFGLFPGLFPDPLADDGPATGGRVWTHLELRPRFHKDMGRVARTEMRDGGLTRVIKVKGVSVGYVVEWAAERVGAPPEVPPEEHPDTNFQLLESSWVPGVMEIAPDGVTVIYTAAGRYAYAVLDPSKLAAGAVLTAAAAEVFGKGVAPILAGGPNLIDPAATATLVTGEQEAWMRELQRWAGVRG